MPQDFSGQNLRGRSFNGQELNGADFSHADIRGANFTEAKLIGANFSHAKGGLQRRWTIVLVIVSLLLSVLSGLISAMAGFFVAASYYVLSTEKHIPIAGGVVLIALAVFFIITIRQGLSGVSATVVAVVSATVVALLSTGLARVTRPVLATMIVAGTVAVTGAGAVTVAGAGAVAGSVAGAGVVTVAGAVAIVGAGVGAWALNLVMAALNARVGTPISAEPVAVLIAVATASAGAVVLLSSYIAWRALAADEKYAFVRTIAIAFAATGGTSFRRADLTDANFTQATLKSTDFRGANVTRTCWFQTKKLDLARIAESYLKNPHVQQLVITGDGQNKKFDGQDLRRLNLSKANLANASLIGSDFYQTNLQEANLSRAKLVRAQLESADLTGACLTGACIEDWIVTRSTKLNGVVCKYVYMKFIEGDKRDQMPPKAGAHLTGNILKLSKIGEIEVILHRPIPDGFTIKQATLVKKADGWYASFSLEDGTVPEPLPVDEVKFAAGIDVGLEKFLATSEGLAVEIPRFYRKSQRRLARQQRQLARMEKGSKNYQRQANKVARLHLHIARERKEFHYQVAHWLCDQYDLIAFENLNIKGLARTRLGLSILDAAWGSFLNILTTVAVKRGKWAIGDDPRGTSIECSGCGERVKKTLKDRVHDCPHCKLVIDRDWNSGINILNRVQRTLGLTESWLWRILGCESYETAILNREVGKPLLYRA